MLVGDLDEIDLEEHFKEETYDCILMADILEHLKENEKILKSCRNLLKKNGKLIVSVPNIAHSSIIGSLFKGKFEYRDEGLLDQTHIRFFTRESIADLIEKCRFSIETIETVQKLPEDTEVGDSLIDLPVDLQDAILNREDSLAIDLRRSFIMSLNERISELDSELSYAQKLAYERLGRANELEEALSYAQKLAYERLGRANELEEALSYAQKLAYERFMVQG
jgi:predicted SAM-dependent methyltransferase